MPPKKRSKRPKSKRPNSKRARRSRTRTYGSFEEWDEFTKVVSFDPYFKRLTIPAFKNEVGFKHITIEFSNDIGNWHVKELCVSNPKETWIVGSDGHEFWLFQYPISEVVTINTYKTVFLDELYKEEGTVAKREPISNRKPFFEFCFQRGLTQSFKNTTKNFIEDTQFNGWTVQLYRKLPTVWVVGTKKGEIWFFENPLHKKLIDYRDVFEQEWFK